MGVPESSGVWRFRELVLPDVNDEEIVTQPEGNTPLVRRERVAAWCGLDSIGLKLEGANPTGSFKDRGMTVAVTQARRVSAPAVACASTGNTSASLAAYAALAGIACARARAYRSGCLGKLAQTIAYGARTLLVRGDFDDCLRLVRAASDKLGVYLANSINPYRIAGQKTIILEIASAARLAAAGLDRAPGRQSRQHFRVWCGAARGKGAGLDRPHAATGRRPGLRRGTVRGKLSR